MSQRYVNQFDYRPDELKPLLGMIESQLRAGRTVAVTGSKEEGWVLSVPQNRDNQIVQKLNRGVQE